jgi:hypothetical protein
MRVSTSTRPLPTLPLTLHPRSPLTLERVRQTLWNLVSDPIGRREAFLEDRAGCLESETSLGKNIAENFVQLLILDSYQKQVRTHFPPFPAVKFLKCPTLSLKARQLCPPHLYLELFPRYTILYV